MYQISRITMELPTYTEATTDKNRGYFSRYTEVSVKRRIINICGGILFVSSIMSMVMMIHPDVKVLVIILSMFPGTIGGAMFVMNQPH